MNLRDVAFKLFWTMVPVVVGFLAAAATEWNPALGTAAAALTQIVTSFARQKLGGTPPALEEVKAAGVAPAS